MSESDRVFLMFGFLQGFIGSVIAIGLGWLYVNRFFMFLGAEIFMIGGLTCLMVVYMPTRWRKELILICYLLVAVSYLLFSF